MEPIDLNSEKVQSFGDIVKQFIATHTDSIILALTIVVLLTIWFVKNTTLADIIVTVATMAAIGVSAYRYTRGDL